MALGIGYDAQACYIARALEVLGERWTLLIVRDCFFGVRRFADLLIRLDISRAVLTERLGMLVEAGVLERRGSGRSVEYVLTPAGEDLWPLIHNLAVWGERHVAGQHPGRVFSHANCEPDPSSPGHADLDGDGRCPVCHQVPPARELLVRRGPGRRSPLEREDPISLALRSPHRLLTPVS